jgi:hypothetical protein
MLTPTHTPVPRALGGAQKTNVYALQVVVGTDIQVFESATRSANPVALYKPNLHVECHDRLLGGKIGLSSQANEVSYTKTYDVQGLTLGVSALYNYKTNTPYVAGGEGERASKSAHVYQQHPPTGRVLPPSAAPPLTRAHHCCGSSACAGLRASSWRRRPACRPRPSRTRSASTTA